MRELTKAMLSFSWAIPTFGLMQMMKMATPPDPRRPWDDAVGGFDAVTEAAIRQLDGAWLSAFKAGNQLQRQMVDLTFGVFAGEAWNPNRWMQMTSEMVQGGMGAVRQASMGRGYETAPGKPATVAASPASGR